MQAYAVNEFGEIGSIQERPLPDPGDGEVLVAVHAAAVNVMDPIFVAGWMKDYMEHRFPFIPGIDLCGVVQGVGSGVEQFAVGDEVYGVVAKAFAGGGSFAQHVVAGAESLAPKPASLTDVEAAAVPHAGLTALAAIDAADPQPGHVVVVVGATGGVGSFVTQLASARGATVVAVSSGASATHAREYGAAATVDYAAGDVPAQLLAAHSDGVDALIDLHSEADGLAEMGRAVRSGGVAISPRPVAAAALRLAQRGVRFVAANRLPAARLPELTALFEGGQLRVPPLKLFRLEQTAAALAEIADGHVRGKLVIAIAGDPD